MKSCAFPWPLRCGAFAAIAALVLTLASCGGGGGDGGTPAAPAATPGLTLLAGSIGGMGKIDAKGTAARFNQPRSIAGDAAGNLYVTDRGNGAIRRIATDGSVTTIAGGPIFIGDPNPPQSIGRSPNRIALDASGGVYFTQVFGGPTITKVGPGGSVTSIEPDPFTLVFGPGTTSGINDLPAEFVFDANGTIYAADLLGHRITKSTPGGTVTVLAGSGTVGSADGIGAAASFNAPAGLAMDAAGNLFVTDAADHTIRKVTPAGVVTTIAGSPGASGSADGTGSAARFNVPQGIAVDASGTLYVADTGNNIIRKIGAGGVVTTIAGTPGTGGTNDGTGPAARFATPTDLALGPGGNLYVTDADNNTIRRVTPSGTVDTAYGQALSTGFADAKADAARFGDSPQGLAHDAAGNVYVADTANRVIRKIDAAGNVTTFAGAVGQPGTADGVGAAARFSNPIGLAMTPAGVLYVTDVANAAFGGGTIRRITPDGAVSTFAGDPTASPGAVADGVGTAARFSRPLGIASDAQGVLYVADSNNLISSDGKTVRRITPDARVTTIAGAGAPCCTLLPNPDDGTGAAARFVSPSWVAVGPDGNAYVVDSLAGESSNIIRKVTPAGQVTTLRLAALGAVNIGGIAVDDDGSIYFFEAPSLAGRGVVIRKLAPDGTITTVAGDPLKQGVQLGDLLGSLDRLGTLTLLAPRTLAVTTTAAVVKVVAP